MPSLKDSLPPYAGYDWVGKIHNQVPESLNPFHQSLPDHFVVVVTGASRGIGAAAAIAFAKAGASGIVLSARKLSSLDATKKACKDAATQKNVKVTAVEAESGADDAPVMALAEIVKAEHGRIDLLINNAGWLATEELAFERELHKTNSSQISGTIITNYVGRFLTIKYLMPLLLESPHGAKAIINVTSIGSHLTAGGAIGYSVSVFASNRLMEAVSERYAAHGVVSYSVHPGAVYSTPPPGVPEWLLKESKDDTGLLGAVAVWLVQESRPWLSGRYMSANWDVDELEKRKDEIVEGDKLKFRMVL